MATRDAAKKVERAAKDVGAAIGPVTLGRKGRRVKLTAVSRFKGSGDHVQATVWGRPTGPWVWVTATKRRRGKARTTSYLKGPAYAHPYGLAVQHPGASGKGAWRRVVRTAEPAVVDTFREAVARICK